MLDTLFLCLTFSLLLPRLFSFPILLSVSLLAFISSFPSYNVTSSLEGLLIIDSLSLFLVLLTVIVLYCSYLFSLTIASSILNSILFLMYIPCFVVFTSNNLLLLYSFYELSLVPIVYIIINWGSYPERSLSALILLLYTSLFSFPLIGGLFYIYSSSFSFVLLPSAPLCACYSLAISALIFLSFSVNLPIYGLHFWLPMAHVEAPTFGSIILAGVLLKLGGAGLIRFLPLLNLCSINAALLSYSLVFLVFSSVLCCVQSDFKRLVAYSSVSHIIAVPLLVISSSSLSIQAVLLLMVFHGLSSPTLFSLVGILYSLYSTRQLAAMRGLLIISPLLTFLCIVSFLFTLSAPPYPSFLSEVLFFLASLDLSFFVLPFLLAFAVLSLVYNLNWLSSISFNAFYLVSPQFSVIALPIFVVLLNHLAGLLFLLLSPLF